MQFEPNRGQAPAETRFLSRGRGYALFLTDTGAVLATRHSDKTSTVRMRMRGGNPHPRTEALDALPGISNYFMGKDSRQWRTNLSTFQRVMYHDAWPGVDMIYHGNQKQLEYDFVVHPGARPDVIRLRFDGPEELRVAENGDLVMRTSAGEARHRKPVVYQETASGRTEVAGRYIVRGRDVAFEVAAYDRRKPLVIDPVFLYSTFFGGNDNDLATGIAVDASGNAYITGITISTDLHVVSPYQSTNHGAYDVFVAKLNAAGSALLYSTYVGGTAADYGLGIAVDGSGNAYVAGYSSSTNFPVVNPIQGTKSGGTDAIAFKLSAAGNQLLFSTYFGGLADDFGYAVDVDGSGNSYIVGFTTSNNLAVSAAAVQNAPGGGGGDAFVLKLTTGGAKTYATYLGGNGLESGYAVAADAAGNAYVTGWTNSTNFTTTAGAFSRVKAAVNDIFVTELNPSGTAMVFSTLIGGDNNDGGYGIAVDTTGVYVAGDTWSTDFPGVAGGAQNHSGGGEDAITFKLDPTGSNLLWATYLGGSKYDAAHGVAVDSGGNVYVTGFTYSNGFPAVNALQTAKAGITDPVYKSVDAGASWSPTIIPSGINSPYILQVSRANPSTVYLADCSTFYRSTNSGATWSLVGVFANGCAQSFAVDPANQSIMYMGVNNAVEKSTDGGATWVSASGGLPAAPVVSLSIDAANANIVYAATNSGLFKTVNGGGSWSRLSGLPTLDIPVVVAHPTLGNVVFAGANTYCAVFRSADGGANWTSTNLAGCTVSGIAFSPTSPNVGYLVTDFDSAKTTDSGVTWTSTGSFPSCCTRAVAVDPNDPNIVYAISNDGLYKSTDGAVTWTLVSGPTFKLNAPLQLAVAPTNPTTVYVSSSVNQSGFVTKLNPTGSSILYSTFLDGGGGTTYSSGIAVDNAGSAFVAGYTTDPGFPTTPGSFKPVKACCTEAFVARIGDATPACSVATSQSARTFPAAGTLQDSLAVLSPSGCPWTASTATSWIHLVSGISGASLSNSGAGTIFFSVDRNTVTSSRSGTITVGSQTFTVNQTAASVLQVLLTPTSTFKQGLHGATYSIAVSNASGAGPTAGTIFVQFTSPSGLSLTSMTGTGWTCTANTCYRSEVLNGGASFPLITVTVDIASNAPDPVVSEASVSGGGTATTVVSHNITPVSANPVRFVPVAPCRIADTRDPAGPFGGPIIAGGTTRSFTVPSSACGIPSTALAYSLNVAAVPAGPLGYLTVWPAGETQPLVSTLNSLDGRTKSNAAVVPAGAGGAISVFASNPSHVVLDINGYFVPATDPNGLAFFPVTPCRIADTRNPTGPLGGPFLTGGVPRTFNILSAPCGIPATARAYALNLAAVPRGPLGYLTVWPTGQSQPLVASLNALTGTVTANAAIVPAGTGGSVDIFASNSTDLVIDIDGYFAPMTTGGLSLYNVVPCRLVDTRQPPGNPPFNGTLNVSATASACGIPASAQAHALSATVVPSGPLGYLTIWPQGQPQPAAATLNAVDGAVTSNLAIVQATSGDISVFASNPTHLVLDIFGYFAP